MAHEHATAVFAHSRHEGSQLFVLVAIAHHADAHGEWRTDQLTLQRAVRLSVRRVQRILVALVASGELSLVSHHGRGKLSTFRILVGAEKPGASARFSSEKPGAHAVFSPDKPGAEARFSPEKPGAHATFSSEKPGSHARFSSEKPGAGARFPAPPGPPFPPNPQIPPYPPEVKKETDMESFALAPRPLSGPQSATFRVNLILEEAGIPLPSPAQIGLWVQKLGGIEPLLEILRRLIQAGLVNKKNPAAYVHRVVMERAARPEPARPLDPQNARVLLRTAGADDSRRRRAQEIIDRAQEKRGKP